MSLRKGARLELEIGSVAYKGKGIAYHEGMVVFVPGTMPGDVVEAMIVKKKSSHAEAVVLRRVVDAPDRAPSFCVHGDVCGGCTWPWMPYGHQLETKTRHVREAVSRIGGLDPEIVSPILGCTRTLNYRNKMEYTFGTRRWISREEIESGVDPRVEGFHAGLHVPGRFDKVLDLQECHLQDEVSYRILDEVRSWCMRTGVSAYDPIRHDGFMRQLVVRTSSSTGEVMACLVTNGEASERMAQLSGHLQASVPEITTIVQSVNTSRNPVMDGRREIVLHGDGVLTERIGNLSFTIRPTTFFQTNSMQAEVLYGVVRTLLGQRETGGHLMDLYCGIGTITMAMSDLFDRCTGIEIVQASVAAAEENAVRNSVSNCRFIQGDAGLLFDTGFLSEHGRPDVLITDPPRAGMHPDVVNVLLGSEIPSIIYVSCDPATMSRDLSKLRERYVVESVQPVDMFPQTYHIENVCSLRLA